MAAHRVMGEKIVELTADPTRLLRNLNSIIDRLMPMHLRACSRPLCVDPVVTVLHDERTDHVERLCAKHTQTIARALAFEDLRAASDRLAKRQRAEFDALDPAVQYGLEGR